MQQKQSPLELVSYLKKRDGKTGKYRLCVFILKLCLIKLLEILGKYILAPPGEREKYVTVDAIESSE